MRNTLKFFLNESITEASSQLLNKLGVRFTSFVNGITFDNYFRDSNFEYQYVQEANQCVEHIWSIGFVNDTTFQEGHQADGESRKQYASLNIFACEIKPNVNFSRGLAVALTRAFNRVSTKTVNSNFDMPVVVIMRQASLLSIATCNRSERMDGRGEKVGKVTLLRNMNCEHLHAGHAQILERIAADVSGCNSYADLHARWFKSFNIDVLSDRFFNEYKEIYEDIVEFATGKRIVKKGGKWEEQTTCTPCAEIMHEFAQFADPEKAVRDYVKNLMGRLVFIQFIQKKGWMGCPAGNGWQGGDVEFMQNLFKNSPLKDNFIDEVLEPLFNDLNTKRRGDLVTNQNVGVGIKIPYLNGGLFEMDKSDDARFPLPAHFLQRLFDFFSSYNFTIDENAPDNVEIGVDPEMLGRIFENLLEDNKEKGAFYTPKEIVQYMCRESLIAYLTTCVMKKQGDAHKPEVDIRRTVRHMLAAPEDIIPRMTAAQRSDFDGYIRSVKVCDPAIGSGAFPMGMLSELVRCRACLGAWAKSNDGELLPGDYAALKAEIIQNNIYGVDIERGAIDIARLRFWLSIIVDEHMPHALPNFDYKFMQGNSLIPTFAGEYINLDTKWQQHVKVREMINVKKKMLELKRDFYTASGDKKHQLNIRIKDHILQLISLQLGHEIDSWKEAHATQLSFHSMSMKETVEKLPEERRRIVEIGAKLRAKLRDETISEETRSQLDIQFFDWRMMFTEVFDTQDGNGGFDIVIGNPPYVQIKWLNEKKEYKKQQFKSFESTGDIYCLFYEKGIDLLSNSSILSFITSNKWMIANYGEKLRNYFIEENYPVSLIDLGPNVFKSATVDTNILFVKKAPYDGPTKIATSIENLNNFKMKEIKFQSNNIWNLSNIQSVSIKEKLDCISTKITDFEVELDYGILTGANKTFILSEEKANELISLDAKNKEIIKPLLRGKDLERYAFHFSDLYLLCSHNGVKSKGIQPINIERDYPTLLPYFESFDADFRNRGEQGDKYYNLRNCAYIHKFEVPKIIYADIVQDTGKFYLDEEAYYTNDTAFMISGKNLRFLLGILNSVAFTFFYKSFYCGGALGTKGLRYKRDFLMKVPIPMPSDAMRYPIESLVDTILAAKKADPQADTSAQEAEIDRLVYVLYGLTDEEIAIIENSTK